MVARGLNVALCLTLLLGLDLVEEAKPLRPNHATTQSPHPGTVPDVCAQLKRCFALLFGLGLVEGAKPLRFHPRSHQRCSGPMYGSGCASGRKKV